MNATLKQSTKAKNLSNFPSFIFSKNRAKKPYKNKSNVKLQYYKKLDKLNSKFFGYSQQSQLSHKEDSTYKKTTLNLFKKYSKDNENPWQKNQKK
jgi:hypothetical protein